MYVGVEREKKVIIVIVIASALAVLLGLAIMLMTIHADRSRLQGVAGDRKTAWVEGSDAGAVAAPGRDPGGSKARERSETVAADLDKGIGGGAEPVERQPAGDPDIET